MEEEKKEKLIIEGNSVYSIDLECWNRKFGNKERKEEKENGPKGTGKP